MDEPNPSEIYLCEVLRRAVNGCEVERHECGNEGDRHDYDLISPGGQVQARVECVELTSQTLKHWADKQNASSDDVSLKFRWEVALSVRDPSADVWWNADSDANGYRKVLMGRIDEELLARVLWAESESDTVDEAKKLANSRGDGEWREMCKVMSARPRFDAQAPDSDRCGELEWCVDGSSSGVVGIAPAVARVNKEIAKKSAKNQAGAYRDPKWLLIQVGQPELFPMGFALENEVRNPDAFSEFSADVDLGIFDEVWVVWETWLEVERPARARQATSVIALVRSAQPRHFLICPDEIPRS